MSFLPSRRPLEFKKTAGTQRAGKTVTPGQKIAAERLVAEEERRQMHRQSDWLHANRGIKFKDSERPGLPFTYVVEWDGQQEKILDHSGVDGVSLIARNVPGWNTVSDGRGGYEMVIDADKQKSVWTWYNSDPGVITTNCDETKVAIETALIRRNMTDMVVTVVDSAFPRRA
jgi:hypothetical protein